MARKKKATLDDIAPMRQEFVLDWNDKIGRSEPLHKLLEQHIRNREMGMNTYSRLDRPTTDHKPECSCSDCRELREEIEYKIFEELDKHVTDRPNKVLFLCWW